MARKKCPQRRAKTNPITETDGLPEISLTKGKIRLKFGRPRMPPPSSSYPNILEKSPVLPNAVSYSQLQKGLVDTACANIVIIKWHAFRLTETSCFTQVTNNHTNQ